LVLFEEEELLLEDEVNIRIGGLFLSEEIVEKREVDEVVDRRVEERRGFGGGLELFEGGRGGGGGGAARSARVRQNPVIL